MNLVVIYLELMSAGVDSPRRRFACRPSLRLCRKEVKKIKQNRSFPLSAAGEERGAGRSDGRVRQPGGHYRLPIAIGSITANATSSTSLVIINCYLLFLKMVSNLIQNSRQII